MGQDIFGRTQSIGNVFDPMDADAVMMSFTGIAAGGGTGLLIQDMGVNYTQDVQRLYELGSANVYFIAGRPAGDFTIAKIAGPQGTTGEFITQFGSPCNLLNAANSAVIKMADKWCNDYSVGSTDSGGAASGANYKLASMLITGVSTTLNTRDFMVAQHLRGTFVSLEPA